MKAYKVCHKVIDEFGRTHYYSMTNDFSPHKYVVEYIIGQTTKPLIGKLFCFDTEKNARKEIDDSPNLVLLEAEIEPAYYRTSIIASPHDENIEDFWTSDYNIDCWTLPSGTIFADSVTLIRELEKK
jgi:hypothetical protein